MSFSLESLFSDVNMHIFASYLKPAKNYAGYKFERFNSEFYSYENSIFENIEQIFGEVKNTLAVFNSVKDKFEHYFNSKVSFKAVFTDRDLKIDIKKYQPEEVFEVYLKEEIEKEFLKFLKQGNISDIDFGFDLLFYLDLSKKECAKLPKDIRLVCPINKFKVEMQAKISTSF